MMEFDNNESKANVLLCFDKKHLYLVMSVGWSSKYFDFVNKDNWDEKGLENSTER